MDLSYDPAKDRRNVALRGLSFELARDFDWASATVVEDVRRQYGERRFQATGNIATRLHVVVFTIRAGKTHVISLRKANEREIHRHESFASQTETRSDAD
ncbi:MAG: BrnT family toxin [Hyphomicrobium sp.]